MCPLPEAAQGGSEEMAKESNDEDDGQDAGNEADDHHRYHYRSPLGMLGSRHVDRSGFGRYEPNGVQRLTVFLAPSFQRTHDGETRIESATPTADPSLRSG
jgi:hypothetical protein